jgi:hypothetical protein
VGQTKSETTTGSCGQCGTEPLKRDQVCNGSCQWNGFGGWYSIGSCTGQGECSNGQTDYQLGTGDCEKCGTVPQRRDRTCNNGCGWEDWGGWYNIGSCSGQGVCETGEQGSNAQTTGCEKCGSQLQVAYRTCTDSCTWGGYSAWQDLGPCDGQGLCEPNEVGTEYKSGVACGNCGTKTQFRQRTCNNGCSWGGWGGWQDTNGPLDGCSGEGLCSAGNTQSCIPSWWDSACYQYGKTCNGDCGWDSCVCILWCWDEGGFDENCF